MNKQGWEVKKLGEICEILDSQRRPITKKDRQSGRYPYFGATGIQDYVADYIFDGSFVLVGEDGAKWGANDRTAFLVEGKCWVNNHAHVLKIKEEIIDRWVIYYLNHKNLNEYITGAVVPKLNQASLRNIPIPVPTFSIQEQIVKELDKLSEIIEKKKKQLAELDTLAQATFYEMFGDPIVNEKGWDIKRLEEVCTKITDGTHTSPNFMGAGIPFLFVSNIKNNKINYDTSKYISDDEYEILTKTTKIEKGDLLYTSVGSYGNPAIVKEDKKFCFQRHIAHLKPKHEIINVVFFHLAMQIDYVKQQAARLAIGVAQKTLNLSAIKKIMIPLPPFFLQTQFAERVKAIEQQKALIEQSITDVRQLFDFAMDKYFH